jgi:hypothetical protein
MTIDASQLLSYVISPVPTVLVGYLLLKLAMATNASQVLAAAPRPKNGKSSVALRNPILPANSRVPINAKVVVFLLVIFFWQFLQHYLGVVGTLKIGELRVEALSAPLFALNLVLFFGLMITERYQLLHQSVWVFCGANVLMAGVVLFAQRNAPEEIEEALRRLTSVESAILIGMGTAFTLLEVLMMRWLYRGLKARTRNSYCRVVPPVILALAFDAVVYPVAVQELLGQPSLILQHLLWKIVAGVACAYILLVRLERERNDSVANSKLTPPTKSIIAPPAPVAQSDSVAARSCDKCDKEAKRMEDRKLLELAEKRFWDAFSSLLKEKEGRWVAYSSTGLIAEAEKESELLTILREKGITVCFVRKVVRWIAPVAILSPGTTVEVPVTQ